MADRSLPGVLLIALVGSSVIFVAFSGGTREKLSILELKIPENMFYSDEEYHIVASMMARSDLEEIDLRLHWLRGVGGDQLEEFRDSYEIQPFDLDAVEALRLIPFLDHIISFGQTVGLGPTLLDFQILFKGEPYRVIFLSVGLAQELFMPERIGAGEGVRPMVTGNYAILMNQSGHLVNFYSGYPYFFYDVDQTLKSLEVGVNLQKTIYCNRTPVSSLPRLRDIPSFGRLRLPAQEDDRIDLLISIDGRSLRLWTPRMCVTEIWVDGERLDAQVFLTR